MIHGKLSRAARQARRLTRSARRIVDRDDYKRGCGAAQVAAMRDRTESGLVPIVQALLEANTPPILIPRKAASQFMSD